MNVHISAAVTAMRQPPLTAKSSTYVVCRYNATIPAATETDTCYPDCYQELLQCRTILKLKGTFW